MEKRTLFHEKRNSYTMVSPQSKRIPVSWTFPFKGLEGPDNIEIVYQKLKNIKWISHMLWNKKSNVNLSVAVLLCWRPCWYPHEKVTNKLITLYKTLIYKNIGIDNPVKIIFFFFLNSGKEYLFSTLQQVSSRYRWMLRVMQNSFSSESK